MKVVLAGSKEYLVHHLSDFLKSKGCEVLFLSHHTEGGDGKSMDHIKTQPLPECDALISFPEKFVIENKKGDAVFKKQFIQTRIEPTQILCEAIKRSSKPPKVWISFSSVAYYPKEEDRFYSEKGDMGDDLVGQLVGEWERAAFLGDNSQTRQVIPRVGLILSKRVGLMPLIVPLFRFGLGSIIGDGSEAFPWIYIKDLYWFILFAMEEESVEGVYNTVAPQMITSKIFSEALAQIMHKKIYLKLPRRYFRKKLGDVAEIVFARSKIYPSRLLKSNFSFRYPAIYPALVDEFNRR